MKSIITEENIITQIHYLRGEKVILDFDLAILYGVETRTMKQLVKRNLNRFPPDFLFILTDSELRYLLSQSVIPSRSKLGGSDLMAFTEQGVSMLSGILRTQRAVDVNIAIMRTFVQLRKLMLQNKDLAEKIEALEQKYDQQFQVVFNAIKQLVNQQAEPAREPVGFKIPQRKQ